MVTNSLGESFVTLLDWALRWWLGDQAPGLRFVAEQMADIRPVTRWVAAVTLALSVVALSTAIMVTRRGHYAAEGVLGLGRFLLVMSGGWLVFAAGWSLSQSLSHWIIGGRSGVAAFLGAVSGALSEAEPAVAASLSVVGAAAVLAFVAVALVRTILAALLVAVVPIVAASALVHGRVPLRMALAWMLAVVIFRPLVSLVYRLSHDLVTTSSEPVVVLVSVPMMLLVSAMMLPLVARLAGGERLS